MAISIKVEEPQRGGVFVDGTVAVVVDAIAHFLSGRVKTAVHVVAVPVLHSEAIAVEVDFRSGPGVGRTRVSRCRVCSP